MTPEQFRRARRRLGWTTTKLHQELNVHRRTVERYAAGTSRIPGSVERLMHLFLHAQLIMEGNRK